MKQAKDRWLQIGKELLWLKAVIESRLDQLNGEADFSFPKAPGKQLLRAVFGKSEIEAWGVEERFVLILALCPHIAPEFLDNIFTEKLSKAGDFPQLGGLRGQQFRGFLPTGETAIFLLAGNDLEKRLQYRKLFSTEHFFSKHQVLWLEDPPAGEPRLSGKIVLSSDYIDLLVQGEMSRPKFSLQFPAQLLETEMEWEDLVLPGTTLRQIEELEHWLKYHDKLMLDYGMSKRLKPGYRVMFHGPPGTGKTLTATLLGKRTGKDVYRVDLSMVVSKFIGETEKNLANLFARAENKDWILFFDEADALFGKRTNVRDAHDKYANQEVSYLLQRIESYDGLVILASNLKSNIDDAFLRRFQSIIHFPPPKAAERYRLWQQTFPKELSPDKSVDLTAIARKYEITGANIVNIVQYSCLTVLARKEKSIDEATIVEGINREFAKEGKIA
ncbi:ATP-binding protein [Flavilitoribacter nigricans]|uniref:AAA family ATPase n=1 Tax=Flavilitoribacter nigricans (strain ATCC 23147 / DSM 23189 / NBRC 102662 / NCIMB 1420 / SS-2) TaxID=1122177 RepID=A0A2D0NEZ2_FLAN2|nr:ATP-binding protein [Flavilitoribacter nigricans]PHN06353.1 AAA family ATPase [Flavilitoribacter nigricans DSM 23189 = NBRC 102662]